ncbi:Mog1p/PsbP-like protein [Testicularia cyperi]|uniref:Mog1p/PsbP-like protein n=1 Tax=Testicularia cyperi TaxID=1882483 RepID=A0A317XLF9_9BASI|nr:Mog1p/PsbP-like protein [Testicularia cyperi]
MSSTRTQLLFGGAITAELPTGFIDASDFRQVPDNQEVLVRDDSDVSLIVEVLQLATDEGAGESLDNAVRFHFGSLAHDNSASSSQIETVELPASAYETVATATPAPAILTGTQVVKKFGKQSEPEETVRIYLALWRLTDKNIDLVMSLNQPIRTQNGTSDTMVMDPASTFLTAARSLQIQDWSLFA